MKNSRVLVAAFASLTAAGVILSAALTVPTRSVADTPKTDLGQVKALYAEKCSACHNLPKPEEKGYTRSEWQRTVNTMLTKYHASESIAPAEAAQIVDYLATFAPKTGTGGRSQRSTDPWGTDSLDVWTDAPNATRVFNFALGSLAGLAPVGAGDARPGPGLHRGNGQDRPRRHGRSRVRPELPRGPLRPFGRPRRPGAQRGCPCPLPH